MKEKAPVVTWSIIVPSQKQSSAAFRVKQLGAGFTDIEIVAGTAIFLADSMDVRLSPWFRGKLRIVVSRNEARQNAAKASTASDKSY